MKLDPIDFITKHLEKIFDRIIVPQSPMNQVTEFAQAEWDGTEFDFDLLYIAIVRIDTVTHTTKFT